MKLSAANAYHAVIQSYPTHEVAQEAQLKLGTIAMVRNQYKQALDLFDVVVKSPMSKELRLQALFLQSIALQTAGDLAGSQKAQEELVDADPDHPSSIALIPTGSGSITVPSGTPSQLATSASVMRDPACVLASVSSLAGKLVR